MPYPVDSDNLINTRIACGEIEGLDQLPEGSRWHYSAMSSTDNATPSLQLRLFGEQAERHLTALWRWTSLENALRGHVSRLEQPLQPGKMGGTLDVLVVALGSGGAGAVLARSLTTWLTQTRADITLSVKSRDGREISVDASRVKDPEALIREIRELIESPAEENGHEPEQP